MQFRFFRKIFFRFPQKRSLFDEMATSFFQKNVIIYKSYVFISRLPLLRGRT